MINALRRLHRQPLVRGALALLAAPVLALAARSVQAQDCPNVSSSAVQVCRAHAGCSYVLQTRGSCERAQAFLERLAKVRGQKPDITNSDVFDAASPAITDPAVARFAAEAKQAVARSGAREKVETRSGSGNLSYYEGGADGSRMEGAGVFINEDGAMARGQFAGGRPNGVMHYVLPDGSMRAGLFKDSAPQGKLARQAAPRPVAAAPVVSEEKRTDDLVELQLISRWRDQGDSAAILVSLAAYKAAETRRTGCASAYDAARCSIGAIYRYDTAGFVNPWREATISYAGRQEPAPSCKHTPRRYSPVPIRMRSAADTCHDQLMLAIHEAMQLGVTGSAAIAAWAESLPVPNTSSGNCKADLEALDRGLNAIRARRPAFAPGASGLPNTQFNMYVQGNRYRVLLKSCQGQPEAERLPAMRRIAGDTYVACTSVSADASQCVARVPW